MRCRPSLVLSLALSVTAPLTTFAATMATVDVPGDAFDVTGDFAGAPDAGGGFTIGIALGAVPIDAHGCRAGLLSVDMSGVRPGGSGEFTSLQESTIKHNLAVYALLQNAIKPNIKVRLHLHTDAKYLFYKKGKLTAPFCAVTINDAEASHD